MRTWAQLLAVVAVVVLGGVPAHAGNVTLKGDVVDDEGNPVEGATVATTWLEGRGFGGVTDAEGKFSFETQVYGNRPFPVLVIDKEKKRGALRTYRPATATDEKTFRLEPLVRVHGTFTCKKLGKEPPPWTNVYCNLMPEGARLQRFMSKEAEFSFLLPSGRYQFHMYGTDVQARDITKAIEGDEGEIDLGAIDLDPTPRALLYGKKFPEWTVTDAHGIEKDVKVADFKGKWLMIEFWFNTCGPCVRRGIPNLMKFWDEFEDRRKEFAIVTMHDTRIKELDELEKALEDLRVGPWAGRALPFPVLLDKTGKTIDRLGISSFPTLLVVDPKGKLVKHGGEHTVRTHLMNTDKAVKKHMRVLKGAKADQEKFGKAVGSVAKAGDEKAAFALNQLIYKELKEPAAWQVDAVAEAIVKTKGDYRIGFFLGKYGVRSEDKARRIAAAKTLADVGDRQTMFALIDVNNEEKDEDVKKALQETMKALNEK